MDSTDLSNLVGRLERQSDHAPQLYVAKVTVVAAVGYAPVALLAIVILVCAWFMIASLLSQGHPYILSLLGLIGGGAILVAVVRALLVRVDDPVGRQISREEAPALFAALDEATQKMAAASKKAGSRAHRVSFDTVRLNREFDTRICQVPGWGVFGNYRNHLQIGIPVLAALNIAEFKGGAGA